jgi:Na+-transporting NADH:ubiquinone oxidoreductase subunit C
MKGSLYSLVFAALLGAVCAGLLTAARELTAARREANAQAERIRHILDALGVEHEADARPGQLVRIFEKDVRTVKRGGLEFYEYVGNDGAVRAVAILFGGRGLWGPIKGVLALEPDRRTVRRITIYEQEETPGLGGEIATRGFTKQFDGQKIASPTGEPGLAVQAITGATMTSQRVKDMLNQVARQVLEAEAGRGNVERGMRNAE